MLDRISDYLAHNKAMPVLLGVLLVILNYAAQFLAQTPVLGFIAQTNLLLHLGIVVGLIGILVGDAL
jgi:hypothetical protein